MTSIIKRLLHPRTCTTALALVFSAATAYADTNVTILTDDAYPPYSYMENHQAAGIYPDILRAAAKTIPGYQLTLEPTPWGRAISEIKSGASLAVAPPYYRPAERPFIGAY